jgi:hypothetical protein
MTDRQLYDLRKRAEAAGVPEVVAVADALGFALQTLGEIAADESAPLPVRRTAGRAWARIRWGDSVPTPFTTRDDAPVWGSIFDDQS